MDNLEQEWNRCMLTGLVHALYRSGMLTQEQQLHLLCELKQTPACTLSTGGVLVCIFIKKQCFVLILPTFQLAIGLL